MHRNIPLLPFRKDRLATVLFVVVLAISAIAHGLNMFNFPYYENDEGVYMSQAWSLLKQGELAPYTYWYDHAPAGWIFIALWTLLTGGFYTFGFSLNSGRVFMLVLHVCSTLLLMLITRKITRSNYAAAIAGLFFALTPIGLYFHRRVLLDNIMTFWVMLSYYFVTKDRLKMTDTFLSAIFFGIAVLTKENAVFFIPGFLVTIYMISHGYHRHLLVFKWIVVTGSVISLYFLYALLKGELFPTGSFGGGMNEHVSLLETLKFQSSREGGSVFEMNGSSFWRHFFLWLRQDPFIILAGIVANCFVLLMSLLKQKRIYLGVALLGAFFWFFLVRGGIVIEFYVVPLIPILSILIAVFIHEIISLLPTRIPRYIVTGLYILITVNLFLGYFFFAQESRSFGQDSPSHMIFESKQTSAQLEAVEWIRTHVDPKSIVIIDNYSYIDLQDPQNPFNIVFADAEWYWKVDKDKEVQVDLLQNNPENIDLIAVTPQMTGDLQSGTSPLTTEALNNSKIWKAFEIDNWGVQLWRPYYPRHILQRSWTSYKKNFIAQGRVIDPQQNITTSEGQSYALLRAVWLDDKETFDTVWDWTNEYLRNENRLFSWKYGRDDSGEDVILDGGSASDADQDIALALLFAHKKWNDPTYLTKATEIIDAIWEHEVKEMEGEYYLLPGPWAKTKPGVLTNPSYVSPFIYRIFQDADPDHDWMSVVDTSYQVLTECSASSLGSESSVFLAPEWCQITPDGQAVPSEEAGLTGTEYSYNAFRTPWKMALDYQWNKEPRAREYLEKMEFISQEWKNNKKISVAYTHDGKVWENYESVAAYSTNLGLFKVLNPELAHELYDQKIKEKFYEDDTQSYWEDPKNYYTQNWAWFGTALYSDRLPNLWETQ